MLPESEIKEIKALVLAPELSDEQVAAILRKYGFRHPKTADANLQSIAGDPPVRLIFAELLPHLVSTLSQSADPDMGLNNFQRFVEAAISRESLLAYYLEDPGALELLLLIFTTSQYLSDILIQNVGYLDWIRGLQDEDVAVARQRMLNELSQNLSVLNLYEHRLEEMRRFKNIETLKIGLRDLLQQEHVERVTRRLSALAEAELEAALMVARARLAERQGLCAKALPQGDFAIIALGKLGGAELNYSSDIDIMFVFNANARSDAYWERLGLSVEEYYQELARLVVEAMSRVMVQGRVFRVDTRLRPDGHMGELVQSDAAALRYYAERSAPWERQALIKARCVAGDAAFGERFVAQLSDLAYDVGLAARLRAEIRQMKNRIEAELRRRKPGETNVKLGQGGIRDIEFVVQFLQLQHGAHNPQLRTPHTLEALRRLKAQGIIGEADARALESAYVFLRTVEHRLQMMHSLQVHTLPRAPEELQKLAIRMDFQNEGQTPARDAFMRTYLLHTSATREIFERFVHE